MAAFRLKCMSGFNNQTSANMMRVGREAFKGYINLAHESLAGLYFPDRVQEYLATKYRRWLKDKGIIQSANRKGVLNDNAEMESFFRQFKNERIHGNEFITEKELRGVIIEYVNFYNKTRIHSSLNYMTPEEYEVSMGY